MKENGDLKWLRSHKPDKDSARAQERAQAIYNRVIDLPRNKLPFTFGLFGAWGSGKTTILAYLAEMLLNQAGQNKEVHIIYFNAWKYAGFMEIVPAMIYKIINASISEPTEITTHKITRVMLFLGEKYSESLGKWVQDKIGVNPAELYKDILTIAKQCENNPAQAYGKAMETYYTQLDKAQDLLKELFPEESRSVIYVLVDELDRCDPSEAFDVIKQLRVFFAMRRAPLVFVLSVNPDPIGLAIKHQYGLDAANQVSDFEAKRILEKFVDSYSDMSEPVSLKDYAWDLWRNHDSIANKSFIAQLDAQSVPVDYRRDTTKNSTMLQTMSTSNYLYSNLRVLYKSLDFIMENTTVYTSLSWTAWHLDILKQMDINLREAIKTVSKNLGKIVKATHVDILRELAATGQIDSAGKIQDKLIWETDKGKTPFAVFRSRFYENAEECAKTLKSSDSSEDEECAEILNRFIKDPKVMDFIIILSAVRFRSEPKFKRSVLEKAWEIDSSELIENWNDLDIFDHFGWLLHFSN